MQTYWWHPFKKNLAKIFAARWFAYSYRIFPDKSKNQPNTTTQKNKDNMSLPIYSKFRKYSIAIPNKRND